MDGRTNHRSQRDCEKHLPAVCESPVSSWHRSNAVGFDKSDDAFAAIPDAGLCSPNLIGLQVGAVGKANGDWTRGGFCDVAC
ncbi:MAG: hypothetical protein H0U18_16180 [Pyrinomonadaceae bacterium]|nr:hypothetical protein [Pyrinomonadaceae bacterium]